MEKINYCNGYRLYVNYSDEYVNSHNGQSGIGIYYNSRIAMWFACLKYLFSNDVKEIILTYN